MNPINMKFFCFIPCKVLPIFIRLDDPIVLSVSNIDNRLYFSPGQKFKVKNLQCTVIEQAFFSGPYY